MEDLIIWVDENDNEIGYGEKLETHIKGQLHRAFSVFIFDWSDSTMLIQRRALGKYHSGGLWSNACCSHPRKGESMEQAINNRLKEELGFICSCHIENPAELGLLLHGSDVIYSCGKFKYFAQFEELSEYEIDNVFLYSPNHNGFLKTDFIINPEEIAELKWLNIEELKLWLEKQPDAFSAWFKPAFEIAYEVLCRQAQNRDMFYNLRGQG